MSKFFTALLITLEISTFLRNYFDDPVKLFSDLYLAKFLDILHQEKLLCDLKLSYFLIKKF